MWSMLQLMAGLALAEPSRAEHSVAIEDAALDLVSRGIEGGVDASTGEVRVHRQRVGEELAAARNWYDALVERTFGLEDEPGLEGEFPEWEREAGQGRVQPIDANQWGQQIFGTDGRNAVSSTNAYPNSKFALYAWETPTAAGEYSGPHCSGVFVSPTHFLMAAHCIFDTNNNAYFGPDGDYTNTNVSIVTTQGTDRRRGYVCIGNGAPRDPAFPWQFSSECEFVETFHAIPTWYVLASNADSLAAARHDYVVVTLRTDNFPSGIGAGRWMALSAIDDPAVLATKVPVTHGYPYLYPNLGPTQNLASHLRLIDGVWWRVSVADQFRTWGATSTSSTGSLLKTTLDAGAMQSGSPIFYYSDNGTTYNGQAHWIIGVLAALWYDEDGQTDFPDDWNGGPTVGQFRDYVTDIIAP